MSMSVRIQVMFDAGPVTAATKAAWITTTEEVEQIATKLAPYRTTDRGPHPGPHLRDTIHSRVVGDLRSLLWATAPYAAYVEFGTRPHPIDPIRAKALHWESSGQSFFAAHVNHPGTRAEPFMRPAAAEFPDLYRANLRVLL